MGDIVGYPVNIVEKCFYFVEHSVEIPRQLIKFIIVATQQYPLTKIPIHNVLACIINDIQAA